MGTRGVLDVCLCLSCGGVGGEWVGDMDQGLEGWCYVCVSLDYLYRWNVQVSVYCAWRIPVHPVFNPVALYGYQLHNDYLYMADIANPDLIVRVCRTWI